MLESSSTVSAEQRLVAGSKLRSILQAPRQWNDEQIDKIAELYQQARSGSFRGRENYPGYFGGYLTSDQATRIVSDADSFPWIVVQAAQARLGGQIFLGQPSLVQVSEDKRWFAT